jgi:Mrp family chromosome partitioning ATPase
MAKLRAVLRRRWLILVITFLVGVTAGGVSASIGTAQRGITFFDAQQVIIANRLAGSPANVNQDALKVNRGDVPVRAAELLGSEEDPSRLARKVSASANTDSNSLTIKATDPDPERASALVQSFSEAFLEVVNDELSSEDTRREQQLELRLEEATAALVAFDDENGFLTRSDTPLPQTPAFDALVAERNRLAQAQLQAQQELDQFAIAARVTSPYSTLGPERPKIAAAQLIEVPESPVFRAGLLGLIGLLLGVGLTLIIERVNQRIDTRDELAAMISVPIIAEIGKIPARQRAQETSGRLSLSGVWSEHYRRVRSAIQFIQADAVARSDDGPGLGLSGKTTPSGAVIASHRSLTGDEPRIFLFVSALPGEGKSTSVALTAMALAETGTETVVINADFRRPMVEKYLGAPSSPSLADRAELNIDRLAIDDIVQPFGIDHLYIAPSGPPTHEVEGRLAAAKEVSAEAAARGATVLLDSSPLRVSNDPIDLLASVDEVILVVRAGRTTVKSIEDTMSILEMHHAPTLGVVLIGTLATREMYAYYQSYYRQPESTEPEPPADPETRSDSAEVDSDEQRPASPSYARNSDAQLPDPPQYLPPPPMPPPFGQPGSA